MSLKKIFLSSIFLIVITSYQFSFALNIPNSKVNFNRIVGKGNNPGTSINLPTEDDPIFFGDEGIFKKILNTNFYSVNKKYTLFNENQITKKYTPLQVKLSTITLNKELNYLRLVDVNSYEAFLKIPSAIYINNKKNIIVGYQIFESLFITRFLNDSKISQIMSLNINNNFLKNNLNIPQNSKITFYENESQGYIERYSIFKSSNNNYYVLLDSFYPKSLEEKLKPLVIETLNKTMMLYNVFLPSQVLSKNELNLINKKYNENNHDGKVKTSCQ
jgi:hypothetical protein